MKAKTKLTIGIIFAGAILLTAWLYKFRANIVLLNPQGVIAAGQKHLFVFAVALMLLIAIPTFIFTAWIAYKYRDGNPTAEYSPNGTHNPIATLARWLVLIAFVVILASVMWPNTRKLDPRQAIASDNEPITIQVVALQWKWLFIYPEQNIATVNFVEFPEDTPIRFELTADAPMNSFWIPALGGQIYAMAGMTTHLNLQADQPGDFAGSNAEISGAGFADMRFTARASTQTDFESWVSSIKSGAPNSLNLGQFNDLAKPAVAPRQSAYTSVEANLFDKIKLKFLPASGDIHSH